MKRMRAEAKRSRHALTASLAQLRKPLAGSGLWPAARAAAALCSGSFEKAYLTKLFARICGAPREATELAGLAAELFMFAALTVDDWSDGAPFRAGKPAIHSTYGPDETVLASNCLIEAAHHALNEAAATVSEKLRPSFLESFRSAALSIQAGQAEMLALSGRPVDSVKVVEGLARLRCGRLISSAMTTGVYLAGRTELLSAVEEAGEWLGIALQYRNDIQDFTVPFKQRIKPPLADLLNGQPNVVVCQLLRAQATLSFAELRLLFSLHGRNLKAKSRPLTQGEFSAVLELTASSRAAEKAAHQLARCVTRARQAVLPFLTQNDRSELDDYLCLLLEP
jgi:geranylgeranyl pyrophosphate synthase